MSDAHTSSSVRPRPAMFRALGKAEPPESVDVRGTAYRRITLYKHDSWAATALYESAGGERIVCKFNRQQRIGFIPMRWLGRLLARHEGKLLRALDDLPQVPCWSGEVMVDGQHQRHAVAHVYVPGNPLRKHDSLAPEFFDVLRSLLAEMHRRGIAYVDLHKRENILVGEDGQPHLIDFQISQMLPRWWPLGTILRVLQRSDEYHLRKHVLHFRPELFVGVPEEHILRRPVWIRLHRLIAVPFRTLRRKLLVMTSVRSGRGAATTEVFPEIGQRE